MTAGRVPRGAGTALLAAVLAGCAAPTPVYLTSPPPRPVAAAQAAGEVDLISARDLRQHPETLGTIAGRPVRAPDDPGVWLSNVIQGLSEQDIAVTVATERRASASLAIEAELRDAWVSGLSTAKTASALVHVRYLPPAGEPLEKLYRGRESSVNWGNGDGEIRAMMDRVFADIREQMAGDIRPHCR